MPPICCCSLFFCKQHFFPSCFSVFRAFFSPSFSAFFFFSLFFFKRKRKTAPSQKKERKLEDEKKKNLSFCLLLRPQHSKMDATAAAAAPGHSGSAPRLRVDELLDDVANSVREKEEEESLRLRGCFFLSVVVGSAFFLSVLSLFLSLFRFLSPSPPMETSHISAAN